MRTIKRIRIDADKCIGCRLCESICAAYHADTKYSINSTARSRIKIVRDEENDLYVPILAGFYAEAECNGRHVTVINGREYDECSFCRASCPARNRFKEPDSGLPLKCDMCESTPELPEPMCVKWCLFDALVWEPYQKAE